MTCDNNNNNNNNNNSSSSSSSSSSSMEESITVEVMLNDDNADDDEGGSDGFSSSDARMFGGLGMTPSGSGVRASASVADQSEASVAMDQSGDVVVRRPQQLLTDKGATMKMASPLHD